MSDNETGDGQPRLLRDRRIKVVRDRFDREPTVNELRAIDALPLEPRRNLNDTSPNGQRIYDLLAAFERKGLVEALEPAGQLLWAQIFAEPDFSQRPRREPISTTRDIAASANAEIKYAASQRPPRERKPTKEKTTPPSPAERIAFANTTSNAFAGSPQKSWMTTEFPVSPSPRRASISSIENDKNNESANYYFQPLIEPPIPIRLAQSGQPGQQPLNHSSTLANQMPGSLPSIYNSGVYTPWPLHSNDPIPSEHQYASPYSTQASTSSMAAVQERTDPAHYPISASNQTSNLGSESRDSISTSSYANNLGGEAKDYDPSVVNLYDPAKSHYCSTLERNRSDPNPLSNSIPRNSRWGYQNFGMTSPGRNYEHPAPSIMSEEVNQTSNHNIHPNRLATPSLAPYDPSSPPFHPAISSEGQWLYFERKEEEKEELARISSNIHQSLANLPESRENQQDTLSSTMDAAVTLAYMPNTGRRTQLAAPSTSTDQSPSSASSSIVPGQSSNNPFVIQDNMGFIHTQGSTDGNPNPTSINRQQFIASINPNPTEPTTKKATTPLPNGTRPQFGKLIPNKPTAGTKFSTNTKRDLEISNFKILESEVNKESEQEASLFIPETLPQIDGASGSTSYQYNITDHASLPTGGLSFATDGQTNSMSDLFSQEEDSSSFPSTNTFAFTFFDPFKDDDETYTTQPVYIPTFHLADVPQLPDQLFPPSPTYSPPPPPPPHLRPHTPEYLLFPPVAASSTKQVWPRPPTPPEGYRQFTIVRDRISLDLQAKRRSEVDLETGTYRYDMNSTETHRGYKMDGTRIRTSIRYFRKTRDTKRRREKLDMEAKQKEREKIHSAISPEFSEMFGEFHEKKRGEKIDRKKKIKMK